VTEDALLPTGTHLGASHFVAGQYLDVTGVTKGKGFAGVMKRWGFAGQGASHGNTKHHRAPGSIGGRTDPGRVWKGKKMPGRLGGERQTFRSIWLYKVCARAARRVSVLVCVWGGACGGAGPAHPCAVRHPPRTAAALWPHAPHVTLSPTPQVDPERNLLYVRGQVPGPAGGYVYVRDAFRCVRARMPAASSRWAALALVCSTNNMLACALV
jgi:ribosomal protein L3